MQTSISFIGCKVSKLMSDLSVLKRTKLSQLQHFLCPDISLMIPMLLFPNIDTYIILFRIQFGFFVYLIFSLYLADLSHIRHWMSDFYPSLQMKWSFQENIQKQFVLMEHTKETLSALVREMQSVTAYNRGVYILNIEIFLDKYSNCLLYTSPSPRD